MRSLARSPQRPGEGFDHTKGLFMNCCREGCDKEATHAPVIHCWAVGELLKTPDRQFRMHMGVPLCEAHVNEACADPSMLITDEGWTKIVLAVTSIGKRAPDRSSMELKPETLPDQKRAMPPYFRQ